ncbi:MAG: hypothetical protein ABW033_07795 [Acidimicrobiia bacterium]
MAFVFCLVAAALIAAGVAAVVHKFPTAGATLIGVGMLAVAGSAARIIN